ncbi:MAG: efflux RND transporter periplasmic adaptor subunit [Hyphomicrobiales bacterium]|nr:efflux RND transporter periplasmic adaptor subunit [Alphaproteobacteria bacterium]
MKKLTVVVGVVAAFALAGTGVFFWNGSSSQKAAAPAPRGDQRVVGVTAAKASKQSVPIRLESLGTVTTMASVAIKARVDSEIVAVKFEDGARVKQGDVLFVLDSRAIESEIKRVQAVITGAEAQFEQASRDVERYADLVTKNATTVVTLNNAQTQVNISRATADSNRATLEGLRVQLSFCTIRAPISGRISMANVKAGNIARQADTAPLATINQLAPIYVSFTVPQRSLPDVRAAISAETASLRAVVPGADAPETGQVTMVENTVDPATGMATVRATMPNPNEVLWPGTLVNTALTLRAESRITIPATALQLSQAGSFVFVIKDNVATVRPVKIERTVDGVSVVESGIAEGDVVVTDGQLLLSNGTRVTIRGGGAGKAES